MSTLTIELPPQRTQTKFNLLRWTELLADRGLSKIEGRIETDRHGKIIMTPPAPVKHSGFQAEVACCLHSLMSDGQGVVACPVSTADGVRVADVAWALDASIRKLGDQECFSRAPEICVEVLSPDNTAAEMREKTALYFDAGAKEVWHCSKAGKMTFFVADRIAPLAKSKLCPDFPSQINLR